MAKQAEAEREKIKSLPPEGEALSAQLADAADIISKHPIALQLRELKSPPQRSLEKTVPSSPAQFMDTTVKSVKDFMAKET